MDDPFSDLHWVATLYPEIVTAWSAEDDAYLARWKDHPHGAMADGEDRNAAVAALMSATNDVLDLVRGD